MKKKKTEENIQKLWHNCRRCDIRILENKEKMEKGTEKLVKTITTEFFSN